MESARFIDIDGKSYSADSCAPLRQAWELGEVELHTLARDPYPGRRLKHEEVTGIKSIGYWDAFKAQNWGLDWHKNEGIEICLLESGALDFQISGDHFHLKPRDLTFTRPWLTHKLGNPHIGASKLHWLILDVGVRYPHQEWVWPDWFIINDQDLNELTTILRQNEQPVWKANTEIIDCFIQISRIVDKSDREHYDTKLKIFVNALFSFFLDLLRKGDIQLNEGLTETKRTVELFLMELNDHLIDDWSLNSMAEHCNLGATQFSKYCREITKCSPLTYLNGLRLRKASVLLREDTVLPVTEIAYQAGFSSPQYFTSAFKKHFQLTPQVFREQCEKDFG